mmetsp:Transcript_7484/g.19244  ORF Transcript_7484/g.19244 Transcript_7484/m.19244 type:complete len:226 (+) Transcript_7484:311-988(+)
MRRLPTSLVASCPLFLSRHARGWDHSSCARHWTTRPAFTGFCTIPTRTSLSCGDGGEPFHRPLSSSCAVSLCISSPRQGEVPRRRNGYGRLVSDVIVVKSRFGRQWRGELSRPPTAHRFLPRPHTIRHLDLTSTIVRPIAPNFWPVDTPTCRLLAITLGTKCNPIWSSAVAASTRAITVKIRARAPKMQCMQSDCSAACHRATPLFTHRTQVQNAVIVPINYEVH